MILAKILRIFFLTYFCFWRKLIIFEHETQEYGDLKFFSFVVPFDILDRIKFEKNLFF